MEEKDNVLPEGKGTKKFCSLQEICINRLKVRQTRTILHGLHMASQDLFHSERTAVNLPRKYCNRMTRFL